MPAKSKKQFKFMAVVASGKKKVKGLTPKKAEEYLHADYKNLPWNVTTKEKK